MRSDRRTRWVLIQIHEFVVGVIVIIITLGIMVFGMFYDLQRRVKEMKK